jgi:hypothetical protein
MMQEQTDAAISPRPLVGSQHNAYRWKGEKVWSMMVYLVWIFINFIHDRIWGKSKPMTKSTNLHEVCIIKLIRARIASFCRFYLSLDFNFLGHDYP